ncbi:hypothetical protein ACH5BF_02190 [Arcobacter sp. YIC-464]|uniref:hypothetical protein n=1 Tax=Arcobacter sp. YIC-464 TaxID=3376631 RepID=UPI003C1AE6A3
MKYLEIYEIKDFQNYCRNRCTKIVKEYDNEKLYYYRGLYKGYLYGINVCNHLIKINKKISKRDLYFHFKEQNKKPLYTYDSRKGFTRGMTNAIYDMLNYIGSI